MNEIETLAAQLGTALSKALEEHAHVTQTLVERKAELAAVDAQLTQMKTQRDVLSAEVGDLAATRDHLLQILNSKPAKAA
jgi:phage shock protein A